MDDNNNDSKVYATVAGIAAFLLVLFLAESDTGTGPRRLHWLAGLLYMGGPLVMAIGAGLAAAAVTWLFTAKH